MKLDVAQQRLVEKQQAEAAAAAMGAEIPTREGEERLEEQVYQQGFVALFRVGKLEIESTMRKVCEHVLGDPTFSKPIRQKRAEALKIMGDIFRKVGLEEEKRSRADFMKEMAEAKKKMAEEKEKSGEGSSGAAEEKDKSGEGSSGGGDAANADKNDEEDIKQNEQKSDKDNIENSKDNNEGKEASPTLGELD